MIKKKFIGLLSGATILVLLCSGIFTDIIKFFLWLFTLKYSEPTTSIAGGIIVRILTFVVSFSLVGLIFNLIGWFNSKTMSCIYFVISTLVSFALSYVVWTIEKYILIIGIVLGAIFIALVALFIFYKINLKTKKKAKVKYDS